MSELNKKSDLFIEEIEDEVVIYDPRTHYVHHLNPMASIIWGLLDASQDPQDITREIAIALKVDPSKVEKDVIETLGQLQKKGLLE